MQLEDVAELTELSWNNEYKECMLKDRSSMK